MTDRRIAETKQWLRTARTLIDALPYLMKYEGQTFIIKYGGHAMGDEKLAHNFAQDVVLLKHGGIEPIIVHGGGPQIGRMLERLSIDSEFIDGLRVTTPEIVDVVEMVLSGAINKQVVHAINEAGGKAIGLSGKDSSMIRAKKLRRTKRDPDSNIERVLDLGHVGEPEKIDAQILFQLSKSGLIPVVAPIGVGSDGTTYNINADTVAGAVAGATQAVRLFLLTDVAGVLDKEGTLIPELTVSEARKLMTDGTISGGMIPKLETCIESVEQGVEAAVILDGRVPHTMLLEIFTPAGVGTMIRAD
jgi:acetylglutamate kinase